MNHLLERRVNFIQCRFGLLGGSEQSEYGGTAAAHLRGKRAGIKKLLLQSTDFGNERNGRRFKHVLHALCERIKIALRKRRHRRKRIDAGTRQRQGAKQCAG